MPIYVNTFKNILLLSQWVHFNETWHEALMPQVLQCIYRYKTLPYDDLGQFYGKVNIGRLCI